MQRGAYVGAKPGQGGGAIGSVVYAAASPGTAWADLQALTERQIANLRRDGGLPKVPQFRKLSATTSALAISNTGFDGSGYYSACSSQWIAGGVELFALAPSSQAINGASQPNLAVLKAVTLTPGVGGDSATSTVGTAAYADAPNGVSYAGGQYHYFTSGGLFSFARTWTAISAVTKYGSGHAGGSSNFNKMVALAGTYVIFSVTAAGITPKYSTDRVTWTNCTIPALNGDAGGADNYINWMMEDADNARILAITKYGELLQSTDGVTFTKLYTRAAGATSQGLYEAVRCLSGKIMAVGSAAAAGQYFLAASDTSGFAATTIAIAGKTFASRAYGVGFVAGICALAFRPTGGNDTQLALSVDDTATWTYVTGYPDGSASGSGVALIRSASGVIAVWGTNVSTGYPVGTCGDKIFTDVAELRALALTVVYDGAGNALKPYIRIS